MEDDFFGDSGNEAKFVSLKEQGDSVVGQFIERYEEFDMTFNADRWVVVMKNNETGELYKFGIRKDKKVLIGNDLVDSGEALDRAKYGQKIGFKYTGDGESKSGRRPFKKIAFKYEDIPGVETSPSIPTNNGNAPKGATGVAPAVPRT